MTLEPDAGNMSKGKPNLRSNQKRRLSDEHADEIIARLTGEDEITVKEAPRPEDDDSTPVSVDETGGLSSL